MKYLWGNQKCIQNLVGKPEGKKPLVRSERRLEDNIRIVLSVGRRELDSSGSGTETVAGSCEHDNEL
jgi:hypothetical protein